MSGKMVLIDGHSILNRAFYGIPELTNAEGLHTNAVYGFLNILFKILDEEKAQYLAVAFDLKAPTFRHKMYPDYKGTRKAMPDELREQVPVMKEVLTAMGVPLLMKEGYEADDFIYSVVTKMKDQYDHVYIHTGDSDLYFLVSDNVSIAKTHSRTKEVTMENYSYMFKKGKFTPYNMITFMKVLNGDTSDDIPAMPVEKAQPLLDMFDSDFYRVRMGDKNFMRASVEFAAPWALPQFDLVYPLDTPVPKELGYGDKQLVREFGYAMKNKLFDGNVRVFSTVNAAINQMAEDGLYID